MKALLHLLHLHALFPILLGVEFLLLTDTTARRGIENIAEVATGHAARRLTAHVQAIGLLHNHDWSIAVVAALSLAGWIQDDGAIIFVRDALALGMIWTFARLADYSVFAIGLVVFEVDHDRLMQLRGRLTNWVPSRHIDSGGDLVVLVWPAISDCCLLPVHRLL